MIKISNSEDQGWSQKFGAQLLLRLWGTLNIIGGVPPPCLFFLSLFFPSFSVFKWSDMFLNVL